uniref:Secreted protein n=1 Tax=Cacopsylla melanoneura TaxID=428564 RepID=A0A8D9F4G6_9HEMI
MTSSSSYFLAVRFWVICTLFPSLSFSSASLATSSTITKSSISSGVSSISKESLVGESPSLEFLSTKSLIVDGTGLCVTLVFSNDVAAEGCGVSSFFAISASKSKSGYLKPLSTRGVMCSVTVMSGMNAGDISAWASFRKLASFKRASLVSNSLFSSKGSSGIVGGRCDGMAGDTCGTMWNAASASASSSSWSEAVLWCLSETCGMMSQTNASDELQAPVKTSFELLKSSGGSGVFGLTIGSSTVM